MGDYNLKFIYFLGSLLFLSVRAQDDVCADVECGQGTCGSSKSSILGYDCACYTGWKQFQFGPVTFPGCVIPNCTINSQCGNNEPSVPPPPPPPLNLTSPCNLVWCGDHGNCIVNGTGYYCQCYDGSTNLLNLTALPCYNPCSFGADCSGLGLGLGSLVTLPPPPFANGTSSPMPRPPSNGSKYKSKGSRSSVSNMSLLRASLLALFLTMLYR